jgi:ABC-type antimicrobial peptide transport system permease subunit
MKELIILLIILTIGFFWASGLEISFNPFSIKFTDLLHGIGTITMIIGMILMLYASYSRGRKDVLEELKKSLEENDIFHRKP